jgi:Arc/MetJ-type ribon-helix-helix transcriptional regulator
MPRITVSISDEQDAMLDDLSGASNPYPSKSAAVRAFLDGDEGVQRSDAVSDERDELAERVTKIEQENERLHRERRQLLEQREENQELVAYAEEQRSIERRRADREERRERAPVWRRAKWWVLGGPSAEGDEEGGQSD